MTIKTLKLTLEVDYDFSEIDPNEMQALLSDLKRNLDSVVMREMGNGGITGDSDVMVEGYRHTTKVVEPFDEDIAVDYLTRQVEDGNINPEDLITLAVRYGMQDPADFAAEMSERHALLTQKQKKSNSLKP